MSTNQPNSILAVKAHKNPRMIVVAAERKRGRLPCAKAKPAPMIGVISGAISMAPMMTAAESWMSPKAASIAAAEINPKNSRIRKSFISALWLIRPQ